jgi:DNA-binding XRE family transcriptional regulator
MKQKDRPEFPPDRIKRIRKGFVENAETFAARLNVTGKTVEAWEQGRRQVRGPALVIFRQLAEVLIDHCPVCSRILFKVGRKKYCKICEVGGGRVLAFNNGYIPKVKKGKKK